MSLAALEKILQHDAIIATFPTDHLVNAPDQVEQLYHTFALAHIALGETLAHVNRLLQWVGGANAGAFIGAVTGNYGEGKTSFQVHIWDECTKKNILAVPPYSWTSVAEMIKGAWGWTSYRLRAQHPDLALKVDAIYDKYRQRTIQELAESVATTEGRAVDSVVEMLQAIERQGADIGLLVTPERFLDFCAEVTEVVKQAGFAGYLVLLDEPEIAARQIGPDKTAYLLFELANGLIQRQGNYGVFVSIADNFLAQAQTRFPALSARLQARGCVPRLGDIYGLDFASSLWTRYVAQFDLAGLSEQIIAPETLVAIGQLSSSDRSDLGYGPRTAVSALRQAVHQYKENNTAYSPEAFVFDCMASEIMVAPDYASKIKGIIDSPEARTLNASSIRALAAFPSGIAPELAESMGLDADIQAMRSQGLGVYVRPSRIGLDALSKQAGAAMPQDELTDAITAIWGQYAPSHEVLNASLDALIKHVVADVFQAKSGQQLLGWDYSIPWTTEQGWRLARLTGAFAQTQKQFPKRDVMICIGPMGLSTDPLKTIVADANDGPEIVYEFRVRWNPEVALPDECITIDAGQPSSNVAATVTVILDLCGDALSNDTVRTAIGKDVTPLAALFILAGMDKIHLSHEFSAAWQGGRKPLLRDLAARLMGSSAMRDQAADELSQEIGAANVDLLGSITLAILRLRYPDYSTIIKQPQWQPAVNQYVLALQNASVPRPCKRGTEPWKTSTSAAAQVFNMTAMNLTSSAVAGLDNLIKFTQTGQGQMDVTFCLHPLEKQIMASITENNPSPRREIDGKECWCLAFDEIKAAILAAGYGLEELNLIVDIGKARQTFKGTNVGRKQILYCPPLDIEQMKIQLNEVIDELESEITEFDKLPDYHTSLRPADERARIENLGTENDYDVILMRLRRELEGNKARLQTYADKLVGQLKNLNTTATNLRSTIANTPEVRDLDTPISGTSSFAQVLTTNITPALKKLVSDAKKATDDVATEASKYANQYSSFQARKTLDGLEQLISGYTTVSDLDGKLGSAKQDAQYLTKRSKELGAWRTLLTKSDHLIRDIAELRQDPSHEAKASELLQKCNKVASDISVHLSSLNLQGLDAHPQYSQLLTDIDQERKSYLANLRSNFEAAKSAVNSLLANAGLGTDSRSKAVFNPADVQSAYDHLYNDASTAIVNTLMADVADLDSQHRELMYARDVLGQLDASAASSLIDCTTGTGRELLDISQNIKPEWVKDATAADSESPATLKAIIDDGREAIRAAKTALRQLGSNEGAQLSKECSRMLTLIPDTQAVDIKQIVLKLMDGQTGGLDVLETSLTSLTDLFRKGKVEIKVARTKKL